MIYLLFLHSSVLQRAQQSNPPTQFWLPSRSTICLLHYLPHHQPFSFSLSIELSFSQFTWICLNCFVSVLHPFVFSPSQCALISRLSRAIHRHIFSPLVATQFTDCITCLANTHFVLVCTDYHNFAILLIFLISTCLYMFHSYVSIFPSQCAPIGPAERPWTTTQKGHP